jgi:hypothetical protein
MLVFISLPFLSLLSLFSFFPFSFYPSFQFVAGVIVLMLLTFAAAIYGFLARPGAYFTSRDRVSDASESEFADLRNELDEPQCNRTRSTTDITVFGQPCFLFLAREIQQDLYVVGAIGLGFATSELTGLLIAMQNFEGL